MPGYFSAPKELEKHGKSIRNLTIYLKKGNEMTDIPKTLRDNIKEARELSGLSQHGTARALEDHGVLLTAPGYAHLETGCINYKLSTIKALALVFGVDVGFFFKDPGSVMDARREAAND